MIKGLGIDMEEISRVKHAIEKEYFIFKSFTPAEIKTADKRKDNWIFYTDNFCAKEAVVKALGCGFSGIELKDVEILRNDSGAPYVVLHNKALRLFNEMDAKDIKISITNTKDYSQAIVIIQ